MHQSSAAYDQVGCLTVMYFGDRDECLLINQPQEQYSSRADLDLSQYGIPK